MELPEKKSVNSRRLVLLLAVLTTLFCSCSNTPVKVRPNAPVTSQASASPIKFGDNPASPYDKHVFETIQARWDDLLAELSPDARLKSGVVVVEFKFTYDGRVLDVYVTKNEAGEPFGELCRRAIVESAPFPRWPSDMRRLIPGNFRDVTMTFNYTGKKQ